MFSTQLQLKFASISEAKIAAQSLCELLKGRISIFDFHGLHVTIGKDGELAVNAVEEVSAMTNSETQLPTLLEDINQAFIFKQSRFSGVCVRRGRGHVDIHDHRHAGLTGHQDNMAPDRLRRPHSSAW